MNIRAEVQKLSKYVYFIENSKMTNQKIMIFDKDS